MTKINIKEFTNYTKSDWLKFLRLQKTIAFDICLPKETIEPFDDPDCIFVEYYVAACIGQELASVAEDFMHNLPKLNARDEFSFIVITPDLKALAKKLHFISRGFDEWGHPTSKFYDYAFSFVDRLDDDEPIHCEMFMNICDRMSRDSAADQTE